MGTKKISGVERGVIVDRVGTGCDEDILVLTEFVALVSLLVWNP